MKSLATRFLSAPHLPTRLRQPLLTSPPSSWPGESGVGAQGLGAPRGESESGLRHCGRARGPREGDVLGSWGPHGAAGSPAMRHRCVRCAEGPFPPPPREESASYHPSRSPHGSWAPPHPSVSVTVRQGPVPGPQPGVGGSDLAQRLGPGGSARTHNGGSE